MTRVLVVEDEQHLAQGLRFNMEAEGYHVETVADGEAALVRIAKSDFDVIVLDVMLPGMDGIELLAERRAAGDRTPVVLLTAHDDERVRERGVAAGAQAFLIKPFAYFELLGCLDQLTLDAAKGA